MQRFCLNCHGHPKDNPLNAGKPSSQWTSVDMTGFEMENWKFSDFAGGVSVSIYKKDFLLLKEPCALDDLSSKACQF
ncbi:MAG: hypothetical protein ACI8WB_000223 [Phenylobacterium sp.]|jgi:hypothetical protein